MPSHDIAVIVARMDRFHLSAGVTSHASVIAVCAKTDAALCLRLLQMVACLNPPSGYDRRWIENIGIVFLRIASMEKSQLGSGVKHTSLRSASMNDM
jgi:hypothetical protein